MLPELEVFETGHLLLAKRMIETGHIRQPGMFQICLGIAWGQPATPEAADAFLAALRARGIVAHGRRSRGRDIAAACGQLRQRVAGLT